MYSDSLDMILERLRRAPPKEVSDRFDFSYNALTEKQRELLHRLSAFASSVPIEAIQLACAEPALVGDDLLPDWREDLSELIRRSFVDPLNLLAFDQHDNEIKLQRYRLHPLMRQYAALKAGEDAMAIYRGRAASLFLAYAVQLAGNYGALDMERENLLAGMDWAYAKEDWKMVNSYASVLYNFLDTRGYWKELGHRLNQTIEACRKLGDKSGEAGWQHNLGILAQATGDLAEARRLYGVSLKIKQELGDKSGVSSSLHQLGILAQATGDLAEARRLYGVSLKISQELGDKSGVSKSLHNLGSLAQATGEVAEARRLYGVSLKIKQELGDKSGVSISLHNLGSLAQDTGEVAEARRLYGVSLKISQELGDRSGVAITLAQSALLEEREGNLSRALELIRQAEVLFIELRSPMAAQARSVRERMEARLK